MHETVWQPIDLHRLHVLQLLQWDTEDLILEVQINTLRSQESNGHRRSEDVSCSSMNEDKSNELWVLTDLSPDKN
ncbi:hypothetical protein WICPIJ_006409 [Wickerhamomyces pijperi]|uniref:Uncharacterized protein n=1 Tax=Wickerhamomyces pijperi TaxID=599730 RepID=A0A9P8Q3S3_WICPI|nr:hypothetical protein WICPIJ_006409 [Wickerhamomyces pijperi]